MFFIWAFDHCLSKRAEFLNDSLRSSALVMSFLTAWLVSLIFRNFLKSLEVSRHPWTAFLFWRLQSFMVAKFTLVNCSINPLTVSWSLFESMYSKASLKQSPIKSSTLPFNCFQLGCWEMTQGTFLVFLSSFDKGCQVFYKKIAQHSKVMASCSPL